MDFTGYRPKDDDPGPPRLIIEPTRFNLEQYALLAPEKVGAAAFSYPRNLKHLRWYWALINVVADGIGYDWPYGLHQELKRRTRFFNEVRFLPSGELFIRYQSIAIGKCTEARFTEYRIAACNHIFADEDLLRGVKRTDVWRRVQDLVGFSKPQGW